MSGNDIGVFIKLVFYVNNLTPSIINTKYTIFMHTIQSNLFNSLSSPSTTIGSPFFSTCINLFFRQTLFLIFFFFFVCTGCFCLDFRFFCLGLIWILLVLVIFSWSCYNFLLQDELVKILGFALRRFVR